MDKEFEKKLKEKDDKREAEIQQAIKTIDHSYVVLHNSTFNALIAGLICGFAFQVHREHFPALFIFYVV